MGGYGSGGRNKTHRTVEGYSRLDSFALRRSIADWECISGSCTTLYAGGSILLDQVAGAADIRMGDKYRPLKLVTVEGIDREMSRLYFCCPLCGRRVRYLYNFRNFHVCRHCLKANYTSQQRNRGLESIRRRMRKLIEKDLGYTWWRMDHPNRSISELDGVPKPRYIRNCVPGGYPPLMVAGVVLPNSWEQRRRRNSVYKTCPDCGAYLDPEERCNCGGPVFRLRVGSTVEMIDQATFMDILQKMKEGQNGRQEITAQG